jgi:hypothetical protein
MSLVETTAWRHATRSDVIAPRALRFLDRAFAHLDRLGHRAHGSASAVSAPARRAATKRSVRSVSAD